VPADTNNAEAQACQAGGGVPLWDADGHFAGCQGGTGGGQGGGGGTPEPDPPPGPVNPAWWKFFSPFGGGPGPWEGGWQDVDIGPFEWDKFTDSLDLPDNFDYQEFEAPSWEEVMEDPGYQFRLQEGQQALERSAAARGSLRNSGTWKDILGWGQGLASQEYGNVYNRRFGEHQQGFAEALTEYDRATAAALAEYGASADAWRMNFMGGQTAYDYDWRKAMAEAGYANQWEAMLRDDEWRRFLAEYDIFQNERGFIYDWLTGQWITPGDS